MYESANNWQFVILFDHITIFLNIIMILMTFAIYTIIYLFQANNIKISHDQHRE